MVAVKGAILSLLRDAYIRRDRIGLLVFRKKRADLILPPTSSVELGEKLLTELPTGGRTPLSLGILRGYDILRQEAMKNPNISPLMVLISDGRANVSLYGKDPVKEAKEVASMLRMGDIPTVVIDPTDGFLNLGIAKELADVLGARYFKLGDLSAETITGSILSLHP